MSVRDRMSKGEGCMSRKEVDKLILSWTGRLADSTASKAVPVKVL